MYLILWEYQVSFERAVEFEQVYGSPGAWTALFRNASGYLGTDLLHHASEPNRYMTIDRWITAEAYAAFLAEWRKEYDELDVGCEGLTEREIPLGKWEAIPGETR